jgi:hypothetical protein
MGARQDSQTLATGTASAVAIAAPIWMPLA